MGFKFPFKDIHRFRQHTHYAFVKNSQYILRSDDANLLG